MQPDWALDDDFGEEGDDEDVSNDDNEEKHAGAEHLLLLFDCDDSMFERYVPVLAEGAENDEDDEDDAVKHEYVSPMEVAVTTAHRFLRTKIRDIAETKTGKRDGVSLASVPINHCILIRLYTDTFFRIDWRAAIWM